jgi:DNA-binding response OmpR family regulator
MRLLIADDDTDLARLIGYSARVLWPDCAISIAPDGTTALRHFAMQCPDLVILDVMMPPPDGFETCRRIRADAPAVPILMLTARDTTLDEVRALDLGADDYLTKPFDHIKLLAHLRALARRAGSSLAPQGVDDLAAGDLTIDFATRQVRARRARRVDPDRIRAARNPRPQSRHDRPAASSAGAGLGQGAQRRRPLPEGLREPPAPETRRRRRPPALHRDATRRRLSLPRHEMIVALVSQ